VSTDQLALLDRYFDALVRGDPLEATDLVLDLLDAGFSLTEIVADVVVPAQARVGELWERGHWSVAQEHTATAVTEAAVSALWVMTVRRQLHDGPRVALACAEGEWHALSTRTAAALAAEAGATVTVLGPSMPTDDLRRRLEVGDVDVLALSCTVPANLLGAARSVAAAHSAGLPAAVGGRAFAGREQRARAVGADLLVDDPQRLCAPLPAAGTDVVVPEEAVRLDAVPDATVDDAVARAVAAHPEVAALSARHQDRVREDLYWVARSVGAAVLTDDPLLLDDGLASLLRLLHGRVPDEVVLELADGVAAGLEPLSERGAALLRAAADRAR
jgi:methanogenic corrinoid protein MtbC1